MDPWGSKSARRFGPWVQTCGGPNLLGHLHIYLLGSVKIILIQGSYSLIKSKFNSKLRIGKNWFESSVHHEILSLPKAIRSI